MAVNERRRAGLGELLLRELRELFDADKQLLKAFPKLEKAARAEQLANLCREGVEYTEERIARLERVFKILGVAPRAKRSFAMTGLIQQAMDTVEEDMADRLRDAALLANIQKISHYGMAAYGTARAYARTLELDDAADILEESLQEKKDADAEMTALAEEEINPRAMEAEEEDDMEQEKTSGRGQGRGRGSREGGSAPQRSRAQSRRGGMQQAAQDSRADSSSGSRRGRPRKSDQGDAEGGRSQMRGSDGRRSQSQGSESRGSNSRGAQSRGSQSRGSQKAESGSQGSRSRGTQSSGSQGRGSQASGRSAQAQAAGSGRAGQQGGARKSSAKSGAKSGTKAGSGTRARRSSPQRSASNRPQSTRSAAGKSGSRKTSSRGASGSRQTKAQNGRRKAR